MSSVCRPQHMLLLITLSPSTRSKGGFQLQACKVTKWKKKPCQDKYTQFHWHGEITVMLAIVKSQGVPFSNVKMCPFLHPLPSQEHSKGTDGRAGTGPMSATLGSLQNAYVEGSNQVPQEYIYECTSSERCQDTGLAGHSSIWGQRGKLSSPYSCFGMFLSPLQIHYHKYFSLFWLPWNYSGSVLLCDLHHLQWSCKNANHGITRAC